MQDSTSEIYANFYRLMHLLADAQKEGKPTERRRALRHPFFAVQRVAPRRGLALPKESEFVQVRCCDLNRAGFSFLIPTRPDFTSLVAAFGTPPDVIYVAAEVSHCDTVLLHPSGAVDHLGDANQTGRQAENAGASTRMVRVGCRFTQRLGQQLAGGERHSETGQ